MAADPSAEAGAPLRATALIVNEKGLHARAAARFVKTAGEFEATLEVTRNGTTVEGTSIMGLMMLAAAPGTTLDIQARGPQAKAALDAILALIADRFGEDR
jgi:phosphocarrier protein